MYHGRSFTTFFLLVFFAGDRLTAATLFFFRWSATVILRTTQEAILRFTLRDSQRPFGQCSMLLCDSTGRSGCMDRAVRFQTRTDPNDRNAGVLKHAAWRSPGRFLQKLFTGFGLSSIRPYSIPRSLREHQQAWTAERATFSHAHAIAGQ